MSKTHLAFVYGSLKTGYWNHRYLTRGGARLLGEFTTRDRYTMRCVGFPLIKPEQGAGSLYAGRVHGELWEVDCRTLAALDALEGEGSMYLRRPVALEGYAEGPQVYLWARKPEGRVIQPGDDGVLRWQPADRPRD